MAFNENQSLFPELISWKKDCKDTSNNILTLSDVKPKTLQDQENYTGTIKFTIVVGPSEVHATSEATSVGHYFW